MPVSHLLKQRLAQQFQQKQQTETLAAQASRAAAHSDDNPLSSSSKGHGTQQDAIDKGGNKPASLPTIGPIISVAQEQSQELEQRSPKAKESPSSARPLLQGQQPQQHESYSASLLGKRDREKPKPKPVEGQKPSTHPALPRLSGDQPQQHPLQKQPSLQRTKSKGPNTDETAHRKFKKTEIVATTPLEILYSPQDQPKRIGLVAATTCTSYSELWTAVRKVCGDRVNRATARLCYQDNEDDWLALLPDVPFNLFSRSVKKLLVVCGKKKDS